MVGSFFFALTANDKKPAETRDRIVKLMGDIPRVELFARQTSEGWHTWGNEVNSDLFFTVNPNGCRYEIGFLRN